MMFRFLIASFLCSTFIQISTQAPARPTTYNDHEPVHIFAALRFPVLDATDDFTKTIMNDISSTYGSTGINLDAYQIAHIQNTYLYLIFLTKLQKIKTDTQYQKYQHDFAPFLQDNDLPTPHLPTSKLLKSAGWKAVTVTMQDLQNSALWQLFCKSMICDTYAYFGTGLQIIHNVEKQEFNFIPHFETSYYNQDYTNLRTINAIVRTKIQLERDVNTRYLQQCPSWKNLPSINSQTPTTANTLQKAIVTFRSSKFYQVTHNMHALLGTQQTVQAGQPITHQQLMSAPQLKSPLKEYVFGYFMLYEMYGQLTSMMTEQNLAQTITTCSASRLTPNIFPYTNQDFVLLSELLAAKSKAEGTHVNSIHPAAKTFKPEDFRPLKDMINPTRMPTDQYIQQKLSATPQVTAQSFFGSLFHDIGHDISKGFDDIKHGVEDAWSCVKHTAVAIGCGIAGVGATIVGGVTSVFDKSAGESIMNAGHHLDSEAQHQFTKATTSLENSIDSFADSIKDGIIAPVGELSGDLVAFVTQDKQLGADISEAIDSTADAIVQVTAQLTGDLTAQVIMGTQYAFDVVEVTADATTLIVSAAEVVFTAGQAGKGAFLQEWHSTIHDCLTAITAAYTEGMQLIKANVAAVMQALGAIINSLTTIFVDLSREITFIFFTIGGVFKDVFTGQDVDPTKYATQQANHVYNVLNAHRQVINQVMGVVICVAADAAVDIATGGAGTAADAEMDVMIMGAAETAGETAAETAGEVAGETAGETAAEAGEESASIGSKIISKVKSIAQKISTKASSIVGSGAEDTGEEAATDAASDTAENSAEDAGEQAATDLQDAVSNAQDEVDSASEKLTQAEETGDEESINAAKESLQQAKDKLASAVEDEQNAAEEAAESAAKAAKFRVQQALKGVADEVKGEAKTWSAKAFRAANEKLENALDSLKSLPKNLAKSIANLARSNEDIAQDAAENLSSKTEELGDAKTAFSAAKEAFLKAEQEAADVGDEASQDALQSAREKFIEEAKNVKQLQSEVKEAEEEAKEAEMIAKETKGAKALRYLKGSLKTAFKPIGLAMNVVFNFTTMISGYNQDEKNLLKQEQEAQALRDLWRANTEMKLSTAQTNLANLEETNLKQQCAVGNQMLGLALYQNYNYSYIDTYQQQIIGALAPVYIMQLLPDPTTNLVPGNTGTLWGLTTNYLDLYPSQGFYTTTKGRSDFPFAQEIAQAPRPLSQSNTPPSSNAATKQWFNQRCTAIDATTPAGLAKKPTDPLSVKINLQFLYTLESEFYVGLYMGGNYHNYFSSNYLARLLNTSTANIQSAFKNLQQAITAQDTTEISQYINPKAIDLNETYLAKMVVLYRKSAIDPISIGVYENMNANPWIWQQPLPSTAQLSEQHTYTLQATLNDQSLNVAVFIDNQATPIAEKIVAVTAIENQRMYGIISSGVAIQWDQINPKPSMTTQKTVRKPMQKTSEVQRAKQAKIATQLALTPKFGDLALTPLSKQAILFNQFMYASTKTDLAKIDSKNPADFLVFATNTNGTISNIGKNPNVLTDQKTNVLVSLITGHVFDTKMKIIKVIPNVWTTYKTSKHGPFSTSLDSYITKEQQHIAQSLSKIKFGSFILNSVSTTSIMQGVYIYNCAQTILSATGQPMMDYLVFTNLPTNSSDPLQLGIPPTAPSAQAILSLVTGNMYTKTTTISAGAAPTATYSKNVFTEFKQYIQNNPITSQIYTAIEQAQTTYLQQQAQQPSQQPTITPAPAGKIGTIQKITSGDLAPKQETSSTGKAVHFAFHPPSLNFRNRQRQAAGGVKFQFHAPSFKR